MKAEPRYTILFNIFFQKSTDTMKFRIIFERWIHSEIWCRHTHTFKRWMEYVYECEFNKILLCVTNFRILTLRVNSINNLKVKFSEFFFLYQPLSNILIEMPHQMFFFFKICAIIYQSILFNKTKNCENTSALYEI